MPSSFNSRSNKLACIRSSTWTLHECTIIKPINTCDDQTVDTNTPPGVRPGCSSTSQRPWDLICLKPGRPHEQPSAETALISPLSTSPELAFSVFGWKMGWDACFQCLQDDSWDAYFTCPTYYCGACS